MVGMLVKRRVGPKGQIVIPKDARDFLGIKQGSNVVMEVKEGTLIVRPQKPADKAVDDYTSVVKRKLAKEIDIKADSRRRGRAENCTTLTVTSSSTPRCTILQRSKEPDHPYLF